MSIDYAKLEREPRLLLEAKLKPLQGDRFQPTGFADLGAARYTVPHRKEDGSMESIEMLVVESAQSIANRMELACWDEAHDNLIPDLDGLPYIRVDCGELGKTNTIKEFHRLNSPYIWAGRDTGSAVAFRQAFLADLGIRSARQMKSKKADADAGEEGKDVPGLLDFHKLYKTVFKWDTSSVLHGAFLEKVAGRLRMTRTLSGFIEARNISPAESGGTKIDHVLPSPKQVGLSADEGFGNVPFPRSEFVAEEIKAYFNLDLALLRGYGLGDPAIRLLIALALFKIRRFLSTGLRLRTACDLDVIGDLTVTRPKEGFYVPSEPALLDECRAHIRACQTANLFAVPAITNVVWERPNAGKVEVKLAANTADPEIPEVLKEKIKWSKATKKNRPKLTFAEGLNTEIAAQAKNLFSNNQEVAKAIDEALERQEQRAPNDNDEGVAAE